MVIFDAFIVSFLYLVEKMHTRSFSIPKAVDFAYHVNLFGVFFTYAVFDDARILSVFLVWALVILYCLQSFFRGGFLFEKKDVWLIAISFLLLFLLVLGQCFWRLNTHSFVLVVPALVFFLLAQADRALLKKMLSVLVVFVVALALYESIVEEYVFIAEANTADVVLDEEFFRGGADLFRAKSIFYGPLTFSAFLIGSAVVLRGNKFLLVICLLGASLAISRTGMILIAYITAIMFLFGHGTLRKRKKVVQAFLLISVAIVYLLFNDAILNRLVEAVDFSGGSSTNNARLYFWFSALQEFSDYNIAQIFFGDNGYFRDAFGNNTESGWLAILLDFGVIGLLLYLFPIIFIFWRSESSEEKLMVVGLFLANAVFTFCYGVEGGFMFWFVVYFLNRDRQAFFRV